MGGRHSRTCIAGYLYLLYTIQLLTLEGRLSAAQ